MTKRLDINRLLDTSSIDDAFRQANTLLADKLHGMRVTSAELLRHKPGRRCLIRYRLAGTCGSTPGSVVTRTVLGKVRAKGLDTRIPDLHRKLWSHGLDGRGLVCVPEWLGNLPSRDMWLQEEFFGWAVDCTPSTPVARHSLVGRALAEFQLSGVESDRPPHSVDVELEVLEERLSLVKQAQPELASSIARIHDHCHDLARWLEQRPVATIHRDFYFDQVLVSGSQVCLLDLDLACFGPRELDAGNYLAHLREFAIRVPGVAGHCQAAERAFVEGYVAANNRENAQPVEEWAIECWAYLSLARHIFISTQFPERQFTTRRLVEFLLSRPFDRLRS